MGTELSARRSSESGWLHAASGALILGLDWVLFTSTVATAGTALVLTCLGGGMVAAALTYMIQRRWGGDSAGSAVFKALLAGVCVGAPLPIGGTALGGIVLAASGLSRLTDRLSRSR